VRSRSFWRKAEALLLLLAIDSPDWKPLEFPKIPRHSTYTRVQDDGRTVLAARSEKAASGLTRKARVDPRENPILVWRWKVRNVIAKADGRTKKGDDYPARMYVGFEYDPSRVGILERVKFEAIRLFYGEYPPMAAISYVWDGREPRGTVFTSPYTNRLKMIVVESGTAELGRWVDERRDVPADYRAAFGEDPPMVSGVAIMTDTDATGESVLAWYGDVSFEKR